MERSCFSEKTLTLSVLTAEFARCVLQTGAPVTARSFLLRGLPMTLALVLITALTAGAEQRADSFWGTDLRSRVVCGGQGLWFVWEAVETFRQAQELCWGNFSSMAMLGLLPLLLWACRTGPLCADPVLGGGTGGPALPAGAEWPVPLGKSDDAS